MTYLKNGIEYLHPDELEVFNAIKALNKQNRSTNNSQIAAHTGIGRAAVGRIVTELRARQFIKDTGKGAAYNWRIGSKSLPDPPVPDRTPGPQALARMFPIGGAR